MLKLKTKDLSNEIFSHTVRECCTITDNISRTNRKINRTKSSLV